MLLFPRNRIALGVMLFALVILGADTHARANSLQGTWRLVDFQSSSDNQPVQQPTDPARFEMTLSKDGRVFMQLGCNRASGTWKVTSSKEGTSGQFSFGPLAGTRALCPPPRLDEFILKQAGYIRSFLIKGNRLHLSLMADGGIFTWQRRFAPEGAMFDYENPANGGPRNWRVDAGETGLNLRQAPSRSARKVGAYPTGTTLDNLGCLQTPTGMWCDVQQLGGGPRGYVAGNFLKPALSPNGMALFGEDDSALRAGQNIFDAQGAIPCFLNKLQKSCAFKVARSGGGYASVVIEGSDGKERIFYFTMGRAIGAGSAEADDAGDFKARKHEDTHILTLGAERYDIPDAVILGG